MILDVASGIKAAVQRSARIPQRHVHLQPGTDHLILPEKQIKFKIQRTAPDGVVLFIAQNKNPEKAV